jgi:hypothetical protein
MENNKQPIMEPKKVIFKYKNEKRKIQNLIYIYVGNIGLNYKNIFDKIKNYDLHTTLLKLTQKEIKELTNAYGNLWITYFFNIYHISKFINSVKSDKKIKKELLEKYDELWLNNFIDKFNNDIIFKKIKYSYSDLIDKQYKVKMGKKLEKNLISNDDLIEYKLMDADYEKSILTGGDDDDVYELTNDDYDDSDLNNDLTDDLNDEIINDNDNDNNSDNNNDNNSDNNSDNKQNKKVDELTDEDIEKLYQMEEENEIKNQNKISKLISEVIKTDNKKNNNNMIEFNDENYNSDDDEKLENVYKKIFVYSQYLLIDDTIKTIKNKISCSIMNNSIFGDKPYILPSRMYLWSEYIYNDKIEKIMIGQKWLKKNNLLMVDVEPLPIKYYENNESPIDVISDVLKKYAGKIKREDENNFILNDYKNYIVNNEIYMIDIYNELGDNFNTSNDKLKIIQDVYLKIYFPKIKKDDLTNIIDYLNGKKANEELKIINVFETINNELKIENEITTLIEKTKINEWNNYKNIYADYYITNSVIHLYLDIYDDFHTEKDKIIQIKTEQLNSTQLNSTQLNSTDDNINQVYIPKIDLYRIMNDFVPTEEYPFIQYITPNGQMTISYNNDYVENFVKSEENIELLNKWFDTTQYGLIFKIKIFNDKYIGIHINELGNIEYKTHWNENDKAKIVDIINTFDYIKKLVIKINKVLSKQPQHKYIKVPEDNDFKFAFINCIQKFVLPDGKTINHNDLSDFSRFFYPYVALIIEPLKRSSTESENTSSKYGTYLKYKRISKYDNRIKMEQRILLYLKNYNITEKQIAEEITRQFNITNEKAFEEINMIKQKYNINSSHAKNNNFNTLPKLKPSGIDINIQGKTIDKYKIKINGAHDENQLKDILTFLNILLFLYVETYLFKNKEYQNIKNKLNELTNIAKRCNKVNDFVNYEKKDIEIKEMIKNDKNRLGFQPKDGQSHWTRLCQNSGITQRRHPILTLSENAKELIKRGYKLNTKTNMYEKKIVLKKTGSKSSEIILKTVKVSSIDADGNKNDIIYSCDEENNGEHKYIGFLTKSNNPFGECMPCCFKKNVLETEDKDKQIFFNNCLNQKKVGNASSLNTNNADILYILQSKAIVEQDRLGFLPDFLNNFMNTYYKKTYEIKNNYLIKTDGYYFKYGINQDDYTFMNTLTVVFDMDDKTIKKIITSYFKNNNQIQFISLNDGDIANEFRINDFIRFIEYEKNVDYKYFKDILKIKGLFTKNGVLPVVIEKNITSYKYYQKQDIFKDENYFYSIDRSCVVDLQHHLKLFDELDILIMIKDNNIYFPIVDVVKADKNSKNIIITKLFNKNGSNKNDDSNNKLINVIIDFFKNTVYDVKINIPQLNISAKDTFYEISNIDKKNPEYKITHQVIDIKHKCNYLITKNKTIIPVLPSGTINNIPIICLNNDGGCFKTIDFLDLEKSKKQLNELDELTNGILNIKFSGLYYSFIDKNDMVEIIGIKTNNNTLIPITKTLVSVKELEKDKINFTVTPLNFVIDSKLVNYKNDNVGFIDERIINVNLDKYKNESYQLFKFELSNVIISKEYKEYKQKFKSIIETKDINKIKNFIVEFIQNNDISFIDFNDEIPNLDYYKVKNKRILCKNLNENECIDSYNCSFINKTKKTNGKCVYTTTHKFYNEFINRLSNELVEQQLTMYEMLNENNYFVSDIVDFNNYDNIKGRTIIKTNIINKMPISIFNNVFNDNKNADNIDIVDENNNIKDIKVAYKQNLIPFKLSILRAYCNGYYWIKHNLYNVKLRNLGYYSKYQNEFLNLFRSYIIDWLNIDDNIDKLTNMDNMTKKYINNEIINSSLKNDDLKNNNLKNNNSINSFIVKFMESDVEFNYALFELYILNDIHKIPIVLSVNNVITYIVENGKILKIKNNDYENYLNSNNICINLQLIDDKQYPSIVEIYYYK